MLAHQHEGLVRVALFLEPLEAQVRDDIRSVSDVLDLLAVLLHARVVVGALPVKDFIAVESRRVRLKVPLSDQGGAVTGLAQEFGEGHLRAVEDVPVGHLAIVKRMPTGKNDRPGRGANRIGDVAALEGHSLLGDAVEVGSLDQFRPIGAYGMGGMIIGEDEEDVGCLGFFGMQPSR